MNELPFCVYRFRLALQPKQSVRIPPNQFGMFYAMLCAAHAKMANGEPAMPDGVMITPPDQAVRWVNSGNSIGLGLTIIAPSERLGIERAIEVTDGLRALGREKEKGQWLRQFRVDSIYDCVAKSSVQTVGMLNPVPTEHYRDEWQRIAEVDNLTLEFKTPLRCSMPKNRRTDGHAFFDDTYFSANAFLNRLIKRLMQLGWSLPTETTYESQAIAQKNELVWLDIGYGGVKDRKTLGGCVGKIELCKLSESQRACLVMGQYVRAGENTRFGFGDYRISELGVDPFAIERTSSLIDIALDSVDANRIAEEMGLESGLLSQALSRVRDGVYRCGAHFQIEIPKPSGGKRTLSIPSPLDRAVQRVVLPVLTEGIDGFLESSSVAYRRGLGRTQAAYQIKQAYRDGFVWAVRADFVAFFDNVSHGILRRRLAAYLSDPVTVAWVMGCIQAGSKSLVSAHASSAVAEHDELPRGLPTGSPLSPVLANLFLDHFDEQIQDIGGRLVRYADDFLILCRTEQQAEAMFESARNQARQLQLELNADKSKTVDFRSGFVFIGFHFQWQGEWTFVDGAEPQLIDDVAWKPAQKPSSSVSREIVLPGESNWNTTFRQASILVGDDYSLVRYESNTIVLESTVGKPPVRIASDKILDLWLGDRTSVQWQAVRSIARGGGAILVVNDSGRMDVRISNQENQPDAALVQRQCELLWDPKRRLLASKKWVDAKICNHAALAERVLKDGCSTSRRMMELADKSKDCDSIGSLLGIEGAAAAMWYGRFGETLGRDHQFQRRVAPDATDPINVMLNMGQTVLHRWIVHWIRQSGLVESIGVMHEVRGGHAALASDMQEPFRHLVDRTVIEASKIIRSSEFVLDPGGPFPLKMSNHARVTFLGLLNGNLDLSVAGDKQSEPRCYRDQIRLMTGHFRCWLEDVQKELVVFLHPR